MTEQTPIPVIGTAIVNNAHWIQKLLDSVDYPTNNFVVFDNNGRGELIEELDNMAKVPHPFIKKITMCHMPANVGAPGAWNLIIKCYMNAPYWIITNHDIQFTSGFLEKMVEHASDPEVGMVHGSGGDFGDGGYDLFLIKDFIIQKYGLFDENFYPAYCEDADYIMRLKHHPIKRVPDVGVPYLHGGGTNYYETGQQTRRGDPTLNDKLNEVNIINFEYMNEKWGPQWRMTWPFFYPFNKEDNPIWMTSYDLAYVRKKYLGF